MFKIINYWFIILKFKFYELIYFIISGKNYKQDLNSYKTSNFKIKIISKAHEYAAKISNEEPLAHFFLKQNIKNLFHGFNNLLGKIYMQR